MRRTLIASILALGLLATPLALADAGAAAQGKDKAAAAKSLRDDRAERADDENGTDGRPAWITAFREQLRELRASWHENATKIRESCHAAEKPASNATKEQRLAWAHCIKDGYKSWLDVLRAERKEARMARGA